MTDLAADDQFREAQASARVRRGGTVWNRDSRRNERVLVVIPARLHSKPGGSSDHELPVVLLDLGARGARVGGELPDLAVASRIRLAFVLSGVAFDIAGKVAWRGPADADSRYELGIAFEGKNQYQQRQIIHGLYLHQCEQHGATIMAGRPALPDALAGADAAAGEPPNSGS